MTSNPYESLDCLVDLGLDMVLTSGQKPTAWEGRETLKALVEQTRNRIEIMAGSGISEANVADIIRQTGITSVHASASDTYESNMEYRNAEMTMSSEFHPSEYIRRQTQAERVRVILMSSSSD
jgi:copper homeostasis protein